MLCKLHISGLTCKLFASGLLEDVKPYPLTPICQWVFSKSFQALGPASNSPELRTGLVRAIKSGRQ